MKDTETGDNDPALERELEHLLGSRHPISRKSVDRLDSAILAIARSRASMIRHSRLQAGWRRFAVQAAAIAATVTIVVLGATSVVVRRPVSPETGVTQARRQTDIVDVYLMAQSFRSGQALPASSDFNQDGVVNRDDVDALARRVVSVSGLEETPDA